MTPALLFRGLTSGDRVGPYLSQFFYLPLSFGANIIDQQIVSYAAGRDYMTTFEEYLAVLRAAVTAGAVGTEPARCTCATAATSAPGCGSTCSFRPTSRPR